MDQDGAANFGRNKIIQMKNTLLLIIAATLFSCNKKKSEDPKPVEPEKPKVVTKQKPVWPRLGLKESNEDGAFSMCGWSMHEKYLRSDTTVSPKVDIYLVTKEHVIQGKVVSREYSREIKLWWANGAPQSDFMVFRPSKDWNFEQSTKEMSVSPSCFMPYSIP